MKIEGAIFIFSGAIFIFSPVFFIFSPVFLKKTDKTVKKVAKIFKKWGKKGQIERAVARGNYVSYRGSEAEPEVEDQKTLPSL